MSQTRSQAVLSSALPAWPRLLAPLLALELGLVAAYFLTSTQVLGEQMAIWFDLDREPAVAAWFSSSQLLLIALTFASTRPASVRADLPAEWFLKLVALGFVFLSVDEAVAVHEAISLVVRKRLPGVEFAWMPIYLALGVAGFALTFPQVRRVWRAHRGSAVMFLGGGSLLVGGAALLELVGFFRLIPNLWEVAAEEFAEMAGGSLMLCAALELRERVGKGPVAPWSRAP